MQRTADWGNPSVPKPTSTHADKSSDVASAPPEVGESSTPSLPAPRGAAAATFAITWASPPPVSRMFQPSAPMPTSIKTAQAVSVTATALKPPKAV